MDARDAAAEFGDLFAEVYRHCYTRRSPRDPGVSPESLALLHHLFDAGPLTVKEASAHFDRSQAAMSEMIQRLIERGLLDKIEDERDRRRHLVWLTEEGRAVATRERQPLSTELVAAAMAIMADEDREQLVQGMRRLVQAAAEHAQRVRKEPR